MTRRRLFSLAALLPACSRKRPPLEVFGSVPDFTLTAQTGQAFSGASLRGHVWVADFIFTTCNGPCPRMTSQMRQVQDASPTIKLVSFTVDPEHDTPPVLAEYARRQHADPARWTFLTGPRDTLHHLCFDAFHLGNVSGALDHSTRFVLIDRELQIRAYYDTSEASSIRTLIEDIKTL